MVLYLIRPAQLSGVMKFYLVSLLASVIVLGTSNAQESDVMDSSDLMTSSPHWIHVQKCCPETQIMVEVPPAAGSSVTKFECQTHNGSVRWAPDLVDDQGNVQPFEESLDDAHQGEDGDVNITKFCLAKGQPCISAIVGKPQCGPVSHPGRDAIQPSRLTSFSLIFQRPGASLAHIYL